MGDHKETDLDSSFQITQDDTTTDDEIEQQMDPGSTLDEIKYIVFKSSLLELFTSCTSCHNICNGTISQPKGTFICVKQLCFHCGHKRIWMSQPMIKDTPAGNVMLSAAILFSGSTPGKILRLMNEMRIACICDSTFYNHQTAYLYLAVVSVWESHQTKLLAECKSRGTALSIGDDGRADSPGHSAKYGSYSLIDFDSNKIIHMELVKSNQVTSSNHMEKEGLSRDLKFLDAKSLQVGTLVTDRHKQIDKFLSKQYPDIEHCYDVWHVSKGVKKKLNQAAKYKDCKLINEWVKSVTNHMYWCAASAPSGNEMAVHWKSLMNHLCDEHEDCYHTNDLGNRHKKWFIPGKGNKTKLNSTLRMYNWY
ncbi:uncharacterized protein [Dysidea avara]|uniref:uncharacterized protein n=1 Tax=Dysidea avara TaxID=196820 RepID=UPI00331D666A